MENVLKKIKELINSESKLMILNENGTLSEIKAGIEIKGKVVEVGSKDELYKLIWGKKRVGLKELQELRDVISDVEQYVMKNVSPASKKSVKEFVESK